MRERSKPTPPAEKRAAETKAYQETLNAERAAAVISEPSLAEQIDAHMLYMQAFDIQERLTTLAAGVQKLGGIRALPSGIEASHLLLRLNVELTNLRRELDRISRIEPEFPQETE